MKPQNPIIKRDADLGWEIFVPTAMLPSELGCVSLSPEGLYIETVDGSWELISFQEMAGLVEVGESGSWLDEPLGVEITRRQNLIAKLTCPVNVVAGQPSPITTGQERIRRQLDAEWQ